MRSNEFRGRAMPAKLLSFDRDQARRKAAARKCHVGFQDAASRTVRRTAPVARAFRKVRRHIRFMLLFCGAVFAAGAYLQEPVAVHRPVDFRVPTGFNALTNSFRPSTPAIGVYDGDTIRIGSERVRLLGFDTPELGHNARCAREARDASRARDFLKAEIARGGDIRVERSGTDRYGRTLAQLYIDGTDVSDTMVGRGLGRSYSGGRRDGWC